MAFLIDKILKIKEEDLCDDVEFFRHLLVSIEMNLDYFITINQYQSINKSKKPYKKIASFNDEKLIEVTFRKYGADVDIYYKGNSLFHLFYVGHGFYNIVNIKYYYDHQLLIEEEYSIIPDSYQELKKRKYFYHGKIYKELRYNYKEKAKAMIYYARVSEISQVDYPFLYFIENSEDISKTIIKLAQEGYSISNNDYTINSIHMNDVISIYGPSGKACLAECVNEQGHFIYPYVRIIEVPNDVYLEVIKECEQLFPNDELLKYKQRIKQGVFTYNQVKNLVLYNRLSNLNLNDREIICYNQSMSTLVEFALCIWQNKNVNESLQRALELEYQVFKSQVSYHPLINKSFVRIKKMRNSMVYFIRKISGKQSASYVSKRLNTAGLYGMVSRNHLSHLLRANLLVNMITAVLISTSDLYKVFSKLISPKQAIKNIFRKTITLIGAATGASVAVVFFPKLSIPYEKQIVVIIGGVVGGYVVGILFKLFLDKFIIDDKQTMMTILEEELYEVSRDFLLNEQDIKSMIDEYMDVEMVPTLQQMYKSKNKKSFASNLSALLALNIMMNRKKVILPSDLNAYINRVS